MPKPTDTGKPKVAPPGQAKKKTKAEERRWKALTTHVVPKKHYTDPADCPQRCLYCLHWQNVGGIFGHCHVHKEIRQHFRFCDQFEAQVSQPVTIPQNPDPVKIEDDPGNLILDPEDQ